jgi:hypothetical protein
MLQRTLCLRAPKARRLNLDFAEGVFLSPRIRHAGLHAKA